MIRKKKKRLFYFFGLSNCFFFAWYMWFTRGGYCTIRKSRHITGLHWMWSPKNSFIKPRWVHYEPLKPKKEWYLAIFHKLLYKGKIVRGDKFFAADY